MYTVLFCILVLMFLKLIPRDELVGSKFIHIKNLIDIKLYAKRLYHLQLSSLQAAYATIYFLEPYKYVSYQSFKSYLNLIGYKWCIIILICNPLGTNDIEQLLIFIGAL